MDNQIVERYLNSTHATFEPKKSHTNEAPSKQTDGFRLEHHYQGRHHHTRHNLTFKTESVILAHPFLFRFNLPYRDMVCN